MTPSARPYDAPDPFWWSLGLFCGVMLLIVGLTGYGIFGKRAGCACERDAGRCMCRR